MDGDFKPAKKPAKSLQSALDKRTAKTKTPAKSTFKTPEEVAAIDDIALPATLVDLKEVGGSDSKKASSSRFIQRRAAFR